MAYAHKNFSIYYDEEKNTWSFVCQNTHSRSREYTSLKQAKSAIDRLLKSSAGEFKRHSAILNERWVASRLCTVEVTSIELGDSPRGACSKPAFRAWVKLANGDRKRVDLSSLVEKCPKNDELKKTIETLEKEWSELNRRIQKAYDGFESYRLRKVSELYEDGSAPEELIGMLPT